MAELIAVGTAESASAEFILTDGQGAQVALKLADVNKRRLPKESRASVQYKTSEGAGGWIHLGYLDAGNPAQIVYGPGTFRVVREACVSAIGVDKS